jgi:predicted nucleotidyltransferase component of viral defense system
MPELREAQTIERFHLAFLQVLQARLDQASYIVKGGVNLRYFFESVRYSEGIDFDTAETEPWRLKDRIDGVLGSPALAVLLRAGGLAVDVVTTPKQTDTTQRWKVGIAVAGRPNPVRTKIEFSRRNGDDRYVLEAIPGRVVAPYALRAPTVMHYQTEAALEQKVRALAGRNETQARDVFDLELLIRREPTARLTVPEAVAIEAYGRALELPYDAFGDQVLPFLDPEVAELYADPATWEQMQMLVAQWLQDSSEGERT